MSDFTCEVMKIDDVYKHPDADRLSIVKVRGYNCISAKLDNGSHRYAPGDLVVYIPEGSIVPQWMLEKMGFIKDGKGMLAGSQGNRVKAVKLRGIVSQGILYPTDGYHIELADGSLCPCDLGDDVSEFLGITKYIPEIPVSMSGEVFYVGTENVVDFDLENIQKYPDLFKEGDQVVFTEKLHGTFCAFAFVPGLNSPDCVDGDFFAYSKGLGSKGLVFKHNEKNARSCIYHQALLKYLPNMKRFVEYGTFNEAPCPIFVFGELYGKRVQDLEYDGAEEIKFRFFSCVGMENGKVTFLDEYLLDSIVKDQFERVPVLYRGPFSHERVLEFRDGKSTLGDNIREGIVITPVRELRCDEIGRLALKAVSPDYLLRKGGTEFN